LVSFDAYLINRFGLAAFSRYRILYAVMALSALTSRITGVNHDMPRKFAIGSGIGDQCATSSTGRSSGSGRSATVGGTS
jgi:hypothetical protein